MYRTFSWMSSLRLEEHRIARPNGERHNRIAGDDDIAAVMRLPVVAPRTSARTQRSEEMTA